MKNWIKNQIEFLFVEWIFESFFKFSFLLQSKSKTTDRSTSSDRATEESTRSHAPLIAKWKNGVKLQLPSKFDDGKIQNIIEK